MLKVDWKKEYKGEFICPYCGDYSLKLDGINNRNKKMNFRCYSCKKCITESYNVKIRHSNSSISWRRDYKIGEFGCPSHDCEARNVRLNGMDKFKRVFRCKVCGTTALESIDFNSKFCSRAFHRSSRIKPFSFKDDQWDLRMLISSFDDYDTRAIVYFEDIQLGWFKLQVKQYVYHLCKLNKSIDTIDSYLSHLRIFSRYLAEKNIASLNEINRNVILDFISWDRTGSYGRRERLTTLRNFFRTGIIQDWFKIDQDIIEDKDYPKKKASNPDPISDIVRKQIEDNLHKVPDPIARMWLIAFFTAMRPAELALLRKNCLVQEGSNWKIVWWRNKGNDQHEIPITRTIAKVVQEQLEYIEQQWGADWNYLFCHYHGLSSKIPSQPDLKPVKQVINANRDPLTRTVRCLIRAFDIRDENDKPAQFSQRLVRPTRLTQLFEQGHDLAVVSAWAGHKRLATTALHYTHVSCELIEKEAGHIQKALFNTDGQFLNYESLPKSFWKNPHAHKLELPGDHINTPIYGYCGLSLDQDCHQFRACYTCHCFVAVPEKLPLYIKTHDELRAKEARATEAGADVLVEQYTRQADQLGKIISSLETTV